ncbi:MAG TPA: TIGR03435 family protein, partial [Bryobacteraceae bacterium]|nr:TIGR03435 family protein [Bryobacteraceae bacterium]
MLRAAAAALILSAVAFAQSPEAVIADVHASAKTANSYPRSMPARGGRYEVKTASMVDMIRMAYGFPADKILGGPSWLEMDRFDVIAKVPADTTPDSQKLILQSVLEDRFKLVVHKDTKPLPTFALTAGKTLRLKKSDGSESPGCRPQSTTGPASLMMMTPGGNGQPTELRIGADMMVPFLCRNMTMAAFARGLRGMMGAGDAFGPNDVLDETGLEGSWNFDL